MLNLNQNLQITNKVAKNFKASNGPDTSPFQADEDSISYNECAKNDIKIMFAELDLEITVSELNHSMNQLHNGKARVQICY